jgi:hypothetical protein
MRDRPAFVTIGHERKYIPKVAAKGPEMPDEERKIIIDEDWKAQVEREREEARRKAEEAAKTAAPPQDEAATIPGVAPGVPPSTGSPTPTRGPDAPAGPTPQDMDEYDEAGGLEDMTPFEGLISGMAAQAMFALGLIAEQGQRQVSVDLGMARHLIDTLIVLRDKTKGNLTERENQMLVETLGELQRLYAMRAQQVQEATLKQQGIDPHNLKGEPR